MITIGNHAPRSYMTCLPGITSQTLISKMHGTLSANQKRDSELNVSVIIIISRGCLVLLSLSQVCVGGY